MLRRGYVVFRIVFVFFIGTLSASAQCVPLWDTNYGNPGFDGPVYTLQVYEDANGPAIYAGGEFTMAGGTAISNIARREGATWVPEMRLGQEELVMLIDAQLAFGSARGVE